MIQNWSEAELVDKESLMLCNGEIEMKMEMESPPHPFFGIVSREYLTEEFVPGSDYCKEFLRVLVALYGSEKYYTKYEADQLHISLPQLPPYLIALTPQQNKKISNSSLIGRPFIIYLPFIITGESISRYWIHSLRW
jgi:hypothetical protein